LIITKENENEKKLGFVLMCCFSFGTIRSCLLLFPFWYDV